MEKLGTILRISIVEQVFCGTSGSNRIIDSMLPPGGQVGNNHQKIQAKVDCGFTKFLKSISI